MRKRLDQVLAERGLVSSRSQASDLVKRGLVYVDGNLAQKSGIKISHGARLCVAPEAETRYVSRGAVKLKEALNRFDFNPEGLDVLDAGASTGGFTEVLLERGAARVYAVDIGHGQIHESLRKNSQVTILEKQDVRKLKPSIFSRPIGAITADLSFISLTKVIPFLFELASEQCWFVALIKPQFEVGRDFIGKGGIVKDPNAINNAINSIEKQISLCKGWFVKGLAPSPIKGGSGNNEFLIGACRHAR